MISATGLSLQERLLAEKVCISLGAGYSADLTRQSTHLLAAAAFGRKFEFAVQHGIRIVHPKWLTACQEKNELVPETKFDITSSNSTGPVRRRHPSCSDVSSNLTVDF